jgi:RNA polymerase sigma-70 factor, ECF subfamily
MASDEELFHEWQQGGKGALEALVYRHHAPLVAHLARLTGDHALAEDLAQETFLRLIRDARLYQYPRPFLPWLYTIARNQAINHARSAYERHVQRAPKAPTTPETPGAAAPDPAEWLERQERRDGLRQALAELTFEQRETLSLRFGQELSVQETAAVLGLPAGTVKSRTFNALRRLRSALEQQEKSSESAERDARYG